MQELGPIVLDGPSLRCYVNASVPDLAFMPLLFALSRNLPNPLRIAEIGCGKARTMVNLQKFFQGRGVRTIVDGYDVLESAIEEARAHITKEAVNPDDLRVVLHKSPTTIPLGDESCDLVISNQVFEHLSHYDEILGECHRILKPCGYLVTCFPVNEIIVEPHLYVPFVHWIMHRRAAFHLIYLCRICGINNPCWKMHADPRDYASATLKDLIEFAHYQSCATVRNKFYGLFPQVQDFSYLVLGAKLVQKRLDLLASAVTRSPLKELVNGLSRFAFAKLWVCRKDRVCSAPPKLDSQGLVS